jgi:hypothetical protein
MSIQFCSSQLFGKQQKAAAMLRAIFHDKGHICKVQHSEKALKYNSL